MLNYFHEDMKYYLSDLNDHGIIVFDTVDMLNSRATELIQLYHSMISNTMNEIMKIFLNLAHEDGRCVILVTHSKEVAAAADEVYRL